MKEQTKEKLKRALNTLIKVHGKEIIEVNNLNTLIRKCEPSLWPKTIQKHENWIKDFVKSWGDFAKEFEPEKDFAKEIGPQLAKWTIKQELQGDILTVQAPDGTILGRFIQPDPSDGLFNYTSGGVIIKYGKYSGCNLKDNESITKHFNKSTILKWVGWALKEALTNPAYTKRRSNNKDIRVMTAFINKIKTTNKI
jgi:hypothetical protein